jgi:hypothetical protein
MVEIEINESYNYCFKDSIIPDYRGCHAIILWLQENLENLTDDNDDPIFSKVNLGYSEDKLKSFTKKATCDVHINNVSFDNDFESSKTDKVDSIVVFKLKGNNNRVAETATMILDYLIQEFATNKDFRELSGIVSDTRITNAGIRQQPNNSNWYCLGVIELSHHLF